MNTESTVRVWDPFVRVFHWSLAVAFFFAYLTEDDFLTLHTWAGYVVLALVVMRIPWGFVGPRHARFSDFVRSPGEAIAYALAALRGRARRHLGHNPAGGLMIVVLLLILPILTLTGIATLGAEEGVGPLATFMAGSPHWMEEAVEETHEFLANFTMLLIVIHVVGVVIESLAHRENLVRAMFTGRKARREGDVG